MGLSYGVGLQYLMGGLSGSPCHWGGPVLVVGLAWERAYAGGGPSNWWAYSGGREGYPRDFACREELVHGVGVSWKRGYLGG
jgi:hypothetical protein